MVLSSKSVNTHKHTRDNSSLQGNLIKTLLSLLSWVSWMKWRMRASGCPCVCMCLFVSASIIKCILDNLLLWFLFLQREAQQSHKFRYTAHGSMSTPMTCWWFVTNDSRSTWDRWKINDCACVLHARPKTIPFVADLTNAINCERVCVRRAWCTLLKDGFMILHMCTVVVTDTVKIIYN